jgi:hypothetical protein
VSAPRGAPDRSGLPPVGAGAGRGAGDPRRDPAAWDAFVEGTAHGSYLQLAGWAGVKAANGWTAHRILAGEPGSRIGMQLLLRRPRPLPWAFGYAPRGPVAEVWTGGALAELSAAIRAARGELGRVSHVRIDPEVEADGPDDRDGALRAAFAAAGWRPAPSIQPPTSRVIDLGADEEALWGDLRKKWRQYVNKARSNGVTVVELPGDPIEPFYSIYRETAERAGFLIRVEQAYRDVHAAFAGGRPGADPVRGRPGRDAAGEPLPRPLWTARRGAVWRDDDHGGRAAGQLPAEVGGDPFVARCRGRLVRHVGPGPPGDPPVQGGLRRPRGPPDRRLGAGPRSRRRRRVPPG